MNQKSVYNVIYTKNKRYNHNVDYKYVEVQNFLKGTKGAILDAGCGEGWNLNRIISEGYDAFGIEISDVCCDAYLKDLPHKCADIVSYAKENVKYEASICCDVLEHISIEDINETLEALSSMATRFFLGIANHSDIQFGHELHLIQKNEIEWEEILKLHFKTVKFIKKIDERFYIFHCEN